METILLDGKKLANEVLAQLRETITAKILHPRLLIIQIGENPASEQYVALKKKRGEEIGVEVIVEQLPSETSFSDIQIYIQKIVTGKNPPGILVQLPLPKHLSPQSVLDLVPLELDIDGLSSKNLEQLSEGTQLFAPAVADGVLKILSAYNVPVSGKKIAVLGQGIYVGKPIADMIEREYGVIVTRVDMNTPNPLDVLKSSDIVISCIGKPHIYNATELKSGAILIDVGTSLDPVSEKIVGDFEKSSAEGYLGAYTPVPGGVGPMTVASLLGNVVKQECSIKVINY